MKEKIAGSGRLSKYNDDVIPTAENYVNNYQEYDHPFPSIVGLACVLNISDQTLYDWSRYEGSPLPGIMKQIQTKQHLCLINGACKGELKEKTSNLILATHHGYSEKTKQEVSGPDGKPVEHDHVWSIEVKEVKE